jgi:hypothetical protein
MKAHGTQGPKSVIDLSNHMHHVLNSLKATNSSIEYLPAKRGDTILSSGLTSSEAAAPQSIPFQATHGCFLAVISIAKVASLNYSPTGTRLQAKFPSETPSNTWRTNNTIPLPPLPSTRSVSKNLLSLSSEGFY